MPVQSNLPPSIPQRAVGPGDAIRFAVIAGDGRRASTWRVWAAKRRLDVYLTSRSMGRVWKTSLHESGQWHHGFTKEGARLFSTPGRSRHLDTWSAPAEFAPGARHGMRIIVPDSELREWKSPDEAVDVIAIPPAGDGHAAFIEILFMPGATSWVLNFDEPVFDIATIGRVDGSLLKVVARQVEWNSDSERWLARYKEPILRQADARWLAAANAPRLVMMGISEDGGRIVVDAAPD